MVQKLRDFRRQQTELALQATTVRLVLQHGYDNVTTTMIAESCGLSVRTFFNYYENKDAAIAGPENPATSEAFVRLQDDRTPLTEGLRSIVHAHLSQIDQRRALMRDIMSIAQDVPRVQTMMIEKGHAVRKALCAALNVRLGHSDADLAEFISDLAMSAMRQCYHLWLEDDAMDMDRATAMTFARLGRLSAIMR